MSTTIMTKYIGDVREKKVGKGDVISNIESRIEKHIKHNLGLEDE